MFSPEILTPDREFASNSPSSDEIQSAKSFYSSSIGVKEFLREAEGSGYWESSRFSEHFSLIVIDAAYRKRCWVQVIGWRFFKLRLLLSGRILGKDGEVLATAPQAMLHVCPGTGDGGYYISAEQDTKLIVLNCRAELLEKTLGLESNELPSALKVMANAGCSSSSRRLGFSAAAHHAAQCIFDSRHTVPSTLRAAYLNSMSMTILCEVLSELLNRDRVLHSGSGLNERELNRIYEVRDYLAQHFTAPPKIPQLARMVGINQSKLKADFKRVLGTTIYQYVLERRMQLASRLLLEREHSVSEIAYEVGYEYPTNFTFAFKKHFGCLPHDWRKKTGILAPVA
jgi:AraC-like DNA-binding protein